MVGVDASYVEELESERLDQLEDAVQGGLVDDLAAEERLRRRDGDGHALEGLDERRTDPAADGDFVVRWFHALSVRETRMTGHHTMRVTRG